MAFADAARTLARGDGWQPYGLARLPGSRRAMTPLGQVALLTMFFSSSVGFLTQTLPLASALVMAAAFLLEVSLYLSLDTSGYLVYGDDGRPERHVFHHLHLAGLCALTVPSAVVLSNLVRTSSPRGLGVNTTDTIRVELIWACIGAYYLVSGLTKVRRTAGRWPDRRLFPFYVTLLEAFHLGDTGHRRRRRPGAAARRLAPLRSPDAARSSRSAR